MIVRNKALWLASTLLALGFYLPPQAAPHLHSPKLSLSEYGFFTGKLADLTPAKGVFPYEVNAPLFSDYAEKARFIYLPEGAQMVYDPENAFAFPDGAAIIKNFFYYNDVRHREQGRHIYETRLLLKTGTAWKAFTYVWNADQSDAGLEIAGADFPIQWTDGDGKLQHLQYVVPNVNQCKGCHSWDGAFVPIGVAARQLNREENGVNQLQHWKEAGWLKTPEDFDPVTAPRLADYRKAEHADLEAQARGYLDANCGHCHNPHGPAYTSGLFLDAAESDAERLGINKPPVAAGRGSGDRRFGIVPGKPQESILVYRMENNDPGIRMPELGRQMAHKEGLELIRRWIQQMGK